MAFIEQVLTDFRDKFIRERIITTNMEYVNFLLVQQSADERDVVFRICDNIGTHAFIPIVYYTGFLGRKYSRKYWNRLVRMLQRDYPSCMPSDLAERLLSMR